MSQTKEYRDFSDTDLDSPPRSPIKSRMALPPSRWSRVLIALLAFAALYGLTSRYYNVDSTTYAYNLLTDSPASLSAIQNSTLGFQKIYRIGLPDRTHKRDAQLIAAYYTNITLDDSPGIPWETIPQSQIPDGWRWKERKDWGGAIGAWRAHMNVFAEMVKNNVESAFIIEDDADWDIAIKDQLTAIAQGTRALTDQPTPKVSPYGDDWDILWVGACNMDHPNDNRYYVVNDPTAPPTTHRWGILNGPDEVKADNTRVVFRPGYAFCLTGYGISLEGARRLLITNSVLDMYEEVDQKWGKMCGAHAEQFPLRCIASYPPIIGMHQFAGPSSRDSDINHFSEDIRHGEQAHDVVYSTTMNIERLLWGNKTALAQWQLGESEDSIVVGQKIPMAGELRTIQHVVDLAHNGLDS